MEFNNCPEEEIEKLSKAIVNAIINSKEVSNILSRLIKNNAIVNKGFMVLIVKLQTLAELANSAEKTSNGKKRSKKKNIKQYIDGRELTPNEIAFLEFCAKSFNEKEWLKKVGIAIEEKDTDV
ncbi:MAG: hypothetical protein HY578_02985 [Nitrospinae bacterium]|nr:hypothetical protein [Nitrospinota bacterium]